MKYPLQYGLLSEGQTNWLDSDPIGPATYYVRVDGWDPQCAFYDYGYAWGSQTRSSANRRLRPERPSREPARTSFGASPPLNEVVGRRRVASPILGPI